MSVSIGQSLLLLHTTEDPKCARERVVPSEHLLNARALHRTLPALRQSAFERAV